MICMLYMNENIAFTNVLKESQSLLMTQCLYKLVLKTSVNESTFSDSIFSFVSMHKFTFINGSFLKLICTNTESLKLI